MHYCQTSRIIHSWQWADLRLQRQTKSALRSLPGVFRSTFSPKTLDSVGFHLDFNRPLITLWDQREWSSFVICYRKWISGRLKSTPTRVPSCIIAKFLAPYTPGNELISDFNARQNPPCAHCQECPDLHLVPEHLTRWDFISILIVR